MALVFCSNGGSNTSPYETWAKAATSLQTAITQAADGDFVILQYDDPPSGDMEVAADVTYTFDAHCSLIAASNDGASDFTPTAMDPSTDWIGNSTTNRSITIAGTDFRPYIYGVVFRISGSTIDLFNLATSGGLAPEYESCYFWLHNNASTSVIRLSGATGAYTKFTNCTFRFGHVSQTINSTGGANVLVNCTVSSSGSTPTILFTPAEAITVEAVGCDFSIVTGTLVSNAGFPARFKFHGCKLGSGVIPLASQTTNPTKASPSVLLTDCDYGDSHLNFAYHDAMGALILEPSIYYTSSDAGALSWKIVTSSLASYRTPFVTPWVSLYHTGTSAVTPRFEILRDGSTTAYTDAQVWGEFSAKTTSGSVRPSFQNDRQSVDGWASGTTATDQAAGAGLGSWTGWTGAPVGSGDDNAWSGKVDSSSSMTPAETGYIMGRVHVAAASSTVYVEPAIRIA